MCGICGIVHADGQIIEQEALAKMNSTLRHRGPSGAGYHKGAGIGLAMRRLSIIDIAGSDQPLYNEDRSIALVFNGEIFNYRALRADLIARGHRFHTEGDGETIAHLYEEYGVECVQHLRGMFAVALWDARERRLLLLRDRMGQKPLYYYADGHTLIFGSEIKALLAHPSVPRSSALDDPQHLALYLGYGYVPAPHTPFRGIQSMLPGHRLIWQDGHFHEEAYWAAPAFNPQSAPPAPEERIEALRETLAEAVQLRMIADVPLGAFLSGGLDSSLIVALMRKASNGPVKTFSIGFTGEESFDETQHAQQVAQHLDTEHQVFRVEAQAMDLLPRLVWHTDQPFADSSAIPTYLVSELTRQHVTVALSGDGGDELFAGYDRFYAAQLVARLGMIPRGLWRMGESALSLLPEHTGYGGRLKRARRFVTAASQPLGMAYFDWVRLFSAEQIASLTGAADAAGVHFTTLLGQSPDLAAILLANMKSYLPDDLLVKADRCSMAASLELRSPFMDHVLIEQVAGYPISDKLHGRQAKVLLKAAARGLLPDAIIDRPKHGFGAPLGAWLRRDSRLVRETLLDASSLGRGLFDAQVLKQMIDAHEQGQRDHGYRLWTLLTLEWWYRLFIDAAPQAPAPRSEMAAIQAQEEA